MNVHLAQNILMDIQNVIWVSWMDILRVLYPVVRAHVDNMAEGGDMSGKRLLLSRSIFFVLVGSCMIIQAAVAQPTFHIPHEVHFTIGEDVGKEGEYAFSRVRLLFADDAYFYVVDDKSPVVRYYDIGTGSYRGSLGRQGDGPQEFQDIYSGVVHDGALWLFDRSLQKMEVYRHGVHEKTLRISDEDFKAPQTFMVDADSVLITHSTLNEAAAVECIDLATRQKSCAWLDLRGIMPAETYPRENDSNVGVSVHVRLEPVDNRTVWFVRSRYDGTSWKASRQNGGQSARAVYSSTYAEGSDYLASKGRVYEELDFDEYYERGTMAVRVRFPYHHNVYSNRFGNPKMYWVFASTVNVWYDAQLSMLNVAYVLYRKNRMVDFLLDTVDSRTETVRTIKIATWQGSRNAIGSILWLGDDAFIMAWNYDGIPVILRVTLNLGG